MPNRFKLFAAVAAVMVITAACGLGEGDVVDDPEQNIAENLAAVEGVALPDGAVVGAQPPDPSTAPGAPPADPSPAPGVAAAEELVTDLIDEIEAEAAAVPKGGYLAGGFFFPFDVATLSASPLSSSPAEEAEATASGYEALTTVTVSQGEDIVYVWQSRGANDGEGRYTCQLSVHEGGVSQLAFEVVSDGSEVYYWDPTLSDPILRPVHSIALDEATWLCPSQPGFFDEVPEFFTLGDIVDSNEDVDAEGSTSGFHVTTRMDAAEAGLDDFEGEVIVTADATRTPADIEVTWPPLSGTLTELAMEEPSS